MKVHRFKIGGETYSAVYNMNVLDQLAEMAGPAEDGSPVDVNTLVRIWSTPYGIMKALAVMIREGERLEGRECGITAERIKEQCSPGEGYWIQRKVAAMMVEGMRMETAMDEDDDVDEVMEEIKKKVLTGGSPSGSSAHGDSSPASATGTSGAEDPGS